MLAAAAAAGTVLALAALGAAGQRAGRGAQPGRRGDDAGRRAGRLRDGAGGGDGSRRRAAGVRAAAGDRGVARGAVRLLVIWVGTNQYATGLALSLFGVGFSAFAGEGFVSRQLPERGPDGIPGLRDIPLLGPALFGHHLLVYLTVALAGGIAWFLFRHAPA